jgi:hypothetical protein
MFLPNQKIEENRNGGNISKAMSRTCIPIQAMACGKTEEAM